MALPTLPRGTRDFGPATMAKRQFIFNNIRKVFQKFGFQPLETPTMENLSTLTGKYGEEGDQLLFKVIDSGDYFEKLKTRKLLNINSFFKSLFENFTIELTHKEGWQPNQEVVKDQFLEFLPSKSFTMKVDASMLEIQELGNIKIFLITNSDRISSLLSNHYYNTNIHSYHEVNNPMDLKYLLGLLDDMELYGLLVEDALQFILSKYSSKNITSEVSEKGLRYDLTVPFARYVVMNRHEITFPFKRYQIQPVWRADRPQKGRYREFYQCDADVVGTDSLICEADIILMIREVFGLLGLKEYTIKINHRGILSGIAEIVGTKENETALFVAIDKLDKIGEEKVREELRTKGFEEKNLDTLFEILNYKGNTSEKINFLTAKFTSINGQKGIAGLTEVLNLLKNYNTTDEHVEFDIALARGLSYYTGCIFEVKINNVSIGSVSGGGRYDNLTKAFGDKENLSGVGFSFGVDRLYDALEELNLFPKEAQLSSKVFICHFDETSMRYGLSVLAKLREASVASEIYPDQAKLKKQLEYANKKMIPYTLVIGSDEMTSGELAFKNMETGEQQKLTVNQIIETLK